MTNVHTLQATWFPEATGHMTNAMTSEALGTTRIMESNSWPYTHSQESHHVPKSIIQMLLELCQSWYHDHFPRETLSVRNYPLGEEPFSNVQPKPPVTQLQAIPLGPVTGPQREEISACPFSSPDEEVVDCNDISLQSSLLQAEQTK
ncbi:hypothetical protein BTVI_155053 [Pitangus sulphuratus]|nr:hypothetical protein BTVI_155053 [Pitangus sulphuratus]